MWVAVLVVFFVDSFCFDRETLNAIRINQLGFSWPFW